MSRPRDADVFIVSRLRIHGGVLLQAMAGLRPVKWVGGTRPYRISGARLPFIMLSELVGLFRAYRSRRGRRKPVVVVHFVSLDAVPAYVFRKLTRSRVLLYAIGSDVLGKRRAGQTAFLRWAVERADCVVCVNRAVQDQVMRLGGTRTSVLPTAFSGFDVAAATSKSYDVVSVGALTTVKKHDLLIESCAMLDRPTKLAIVGDGPLRPYLQSRSAGNAEHQVALLGMLPREDVFKVLSSSRLYVQCSAYEGVPMSVLEAAWVGLPLVVVEGGYTRDLEDLYQLKLLVVREPSQEALSSSVKFALDNYTELASQASSNREAMVQYAKSWELAAESLLEVYS